MLSPKQRKDANRRVAGIVRPLDPGDPRNIDHPCHRKQWLELARAIGKLEAREKFNLLQRQRTGSKPK
jgi:hypothetical protein